MMKPERIRIEDWCIGTLGGGLAAPELLPASLFGKVYGHPRFPDGHEITTSSLVSLDVKAGTAETFSGSKYTLGKPNEQYAQWCEAQGKNLN